MADQEYCLLFVDRWAWWHDHWAMCMTRGEWASWVQGIGTIIAVVASAWVVRWQVRQAQNADTAKERNRVLAHLLQLHELAGELKRLSEDHRSRFSSRRDVVAMGQAGSWPNLEEIIAIADRLDQFVATDLPPSAFRLAGALAKAARRLVKISDRAHVRWRYLTDAEYDGYATDLAKSYPTVVLGAGGVANALEQF